MRQIFKNSYVVTYLAYFLGLLLAIVLFLLPLLIAVVLNGGHRLNNGEGAFWGGLFAELVGFILLIIGVFALPPLSVYYFLNKQQISASKRTALLCLLLTPTLIVAAPAFIVPLVAHFIALHTQPKDPAPENNDPPSSANFISA